MIGQKQGSVEISASKRTHFRSRAIDFSTVKNSYHSLDRDGLGRIHCSMAGVGKLMKQAAKMQKKMQELQDQLAAQTLEVSSGGGAVKVVVTLQQAVQGLEIDGDFLKEDKAIVEEAILEAFREAIEQSKAKSEEAMNAITQSAQLPGLFS